MRLLVLIILPFLISANFFEQFFGGNQEQEEEEGKQEARAASNECQFYYCPFSKECVDLPINCKCKGSKCRLGDWYYCSSDCNAIGLSVF